MRPSRLSRLPMAAAVWRLLCLTVLLSGPASMDARAERVLADFSTTTGVKAIRASGDVGTAPVSTPDGVGLQLTCRPGKPWATIELAPSLLADWAKWDRLAIDLSSETLPAPVPIAVEFIDAAGADYPMRSSWGEDPRQLPLLRGGMTRLRIPLAAARRNGRDGHDPAPDRTVDGIDFTELKRVKIWFDTRGLDAPLTVVLQSVRLQTAEERDDRMELKLPPASRIYRFGGADDLVDAVKVRPDSGWRLETGWGWLGQAGLGQEGSGFPDPLAGWFAGTGENAEDTARRPPSEAVFRVDLPPGDWVVWLCAPRFPYPGLRPRIRIGEFTAVDEQFTPATAMTAGAMLAGFDQIWRPERKAIWQDWIAPLAPVCCRTVRVGADGLQIELRDSAIASLIICPGGSLSPEKLAADIAAIRVDWFYSHYWRQPLPADTLPAPQHISGRWLDGDVIDVIDVIDVAPGERLHLQLLIEADGFCADAGIGLDQPAAVALEAVWHRTVYRTNGLEELPAYLLPVEKVPLRPGRQERIWLSVTVPDTQPAGPCRLEAVLRAGPLECRVPLTLRVRSVKLPQDLPYAIGYFYRPPQQGQYAALEQLPAADCDRLLTEQMQILAHYGCTSVQLPDVQARGIRHGVPSLDFSRADAALAAARAAGLLRGPGQVAPLYWLSTARSAMRRLKGGEAAPGEEFTLAGADRVLAAAQMDIVRWQKQNQVPMVLYTVDEPREPPKPWNRGIDDTLRHLELLQSTGLPRLVTFTGDDTRGRSLLPIGRAADIIAVHPRSNAKALIALAKERTLWWYNTGNSRLNRGLHIWATGATGHFNWHFHGWAREEQQPHWPGYLPHNPFTARDRNAATAPAPLEVAGAVTPTPWLLVTAQGTRDLRWLQALVAAAAAAPETAAAAEAAALLKELRAGIPLYVDDGGLARDRAEAELPAWHARMAVLLEQLQQGR